MKSHQPWMLDSTAPIPPSIKGLIFDCDGTLVDTMPVHYEAWKRALHPHGIDLPEDRFYGFAGMPTQKIIETLAQEMGLEVDAPAIAHEKERLYIQRIPEVKTIQAVVAIARRERGHRKLAVASGGWKRVVMQSLKAISIENLFDVVVGADDVNHGKPAPDIFLLAAEKMGIAPSECLVYEDGELGFQAARAAEMPVVDVRPWYAATQF